METDKILNLPEFRVNVVIVEQKETTQISITLKSKSALFVY